MTSIRTDVERDVDSPAADRAQTFFDWTRLNSRLLTSLVVALAVVAAAYWFYVRSQAIKSANAERALLTAQQSMQAGNLALAQSDLQKVTTEYGSTSAGVRAALLLAQMDYDAGKYQDGLNALQKLSGGAASDAQYSIRSLEGDGYMQLGKGTEAAKTYLDAASVAPGDLEAAAERAKAARAYMALGDKANARQLWSDLANDPKAANVAAEARIRLGELDAAAAGAAVKK